MYVSYIIVRCICMNFELANFKFKFGFERKTCTYYKIKHFVKTIILMLDYIRLTSLK